ncbi:C-type lectin domain family 4 member G-like isoform X1 [Monodon monoceros]|uniref:C-type lectin domain family 4 member G-like isoform X1 n=1 Tax=Monodon monoceros TaxID=40151 RepID=UPI0010F7B4A2|nr:C-type lectin domain family 4 member G-like isoform X1 [Monodon monoceros]
MSVHHGHGRVQQVGRQAGGGPRRALGTLGTETPPPGPGSLGGHNPVGPRSERPVFQGVPAPLGPWEEFPSPPLSAASTERRALLGQQDLLRTNSSKQTAVLGVLKEEVRACNSCCLGTQAQLQTVHTKLREAQSKLIQQESTLKELSERVTQSLAEASRDRENIRTELFRALEGVRLGNSSCEECPKSWLPFQGSCYLFSTQRATWVEAQRHCEGARAHLVIVGGLDEQGFLSRNTGGRGYWLGLRAVRRARRIQGYQWVDGVPLSFSHWNQGEPNDSLGREDCIMILRTGMWNDAPCDNRDDSWICEKRLSC